MGLSTAGRAARGALPLSARLAPAVGIVSIACFFFVVFTPLNDERFDPTRLVQRWRSQSVAHLSWRVSLWQVRSHLELCFPWAALRCSWRLSPRQACYKLIETQMLDAARCAAAYSIRARLLQARPPCTVRRVPPCRTRCPLFA